MPAATLTAEMLPTYLAAVHEAVPQTPVSCLSVGSPYPACEDAQRMRRLRSDDNKYTVCTLDVHYLNWLHLASGCIFVGDVYVSLEICNVRLCLKLCILCPPCISVPSWAVAQRLPTHLWQPPDFWAYSLLSFYNCWNSLVGYVPRKTGFSK